MADVAYMPARLHWPSAMKRILKGGGNSSASSTSSTSRTRSSSTTTSSGDRSSKGTSSEPKLNLSFKRNKRKEAVKQLISAFDIPPPMEIDETQPPTLSVWMEQARWETSVQAVFPVFEHEELPT